MKPIKIDVSKMGDVKIENKDGVVTITPIHQEKWPNVGYYCDGDSDILKWHPNDSEQWERLRNVYPYRQHAELFGQVLAPLLVKHYVLTGGYWDENPERKVCYNSDQCCWRVLNSRFYCLDLSVCNFPFQNEELAKQFLEENSEQLNKITELWQLK